jgi:D-alanyl-lipoteichoic acid acyltransferase DltB (MBOAT superfamily)
MLFNSFAFLFFFVLVLALHLLPLPWWLRKFNLLVASYLFYMAWNPPFVGLLIISTLIDWFAARAMGRSENPLTRKLLLLVSLCANLGILGFFKYAESSLLYFTELMQWLGVDYQPPYSEWDIVLPLGISFYTFQTLSYTIDVYRRKMEPWHSVLDFALFVSFFPQLIAGPIVRAGQFLPQCTEPKRPSGDQFGWGLSLIVLGMFLKIVLADSLFAPVVNTVYKAGLQPSMFDAWIGTLAFVGQLYSDFSGYSTCAVGLALCLGFVIPANFRFPMASIGFSDFWRRWHISLSTWLHDYIFQPLGGYFVPRWRAASNLMVTMVLCGLWHGPTVNFLIFGALHGAYMVSEMALRGTRIYRLQIWRTIVGKVFLWAITVVSLSFTLVFFRAQTLAQAGTICQALLGFGSQTTLSFVSDVDFLLVLLPLELIAVTHALLRRQTLEEAVRRWPWWVWSILTALMLYAIVRVPGSVDSEEFIYFQF